MRLRGLLRRWAADLRIFWAANLHVAATWRQEPRRLVRYVLATWVVDGLALAALAWALAPVRILDPHSLVAAVALLAAANALVRPVIVRFLVRWTVLVFALVSLVLNGAMLALVARILPGFEVGSLPVAVAVSLVLALVNLVLGVLLDLDWADSWYRQVVLELLRRHRTAPYDGPGLLVVQIDGLAEPVLRAAVRAGNVPHLAGWLRGGTHRLVPWEVLLPSQTSASQAGILHGRNDGIPAFRWYEKATGRLVVSNRPADAAEIERRVSDGRGLLADGGSSVTNLLSGDAPRSILTNSTLLRGDGVRGQDFFGYFADPGTVFRAIALSVVEVARESMQARRQRLRGVVPRIARAWPFPLLRAAACVVLRDLSVQLVLEEMYRGVPIIYVDLVGYDEVAHHAGPERPEALDALAEVDRQVGLLARAAASAPRPYRVVVLSDHGQSQGATFRQRWGTTLEDLVGGLVGGDPSLLAATSSVEGWGYVNAVLVELAAGRGTGARIAGRRLGSRAAEALHPAPATGPGRPAPRPHPAGAAGDEGPRDVVVAASGNLAHVYLTAHPGRSTWEELGAAHPGLVEALASHPGIGLVLVRGADGPTAVGAGGVRSLLTGAVTGADPLAAYGPHAAAGLLAVDACDGCGDLVVVSAVDPATGEVAAFEELVGSHGGLGGAQTAAFLVHPAELRPPDGPLVGAPAVHAVLAGWLSELGLRPARPG